MPSNTCCFTEYDSVSNFDEQNHVCCCKIIGFFSFRYLLALETSKPNSHRSLVAIKEHGILITVDSKEFWVIGRLFSIPSKELYVCHRADVPQNLVELAFRLSLNSAG